MFFWSVRTFVQNDMIDYLYVLFSNLTLLGPIAGYWVTIFMVLIGWAIQKFQITLTEGLALLFWVPISQVVGYMQMIWILKVRFAYSGPR